MPAAGVPEVAHADVLRYRGDRGVRRGGGGRGDRLGAPHRRRAAGAPGVPGPGADAAGDPRGARGVADHQRHAAGPLRRGVAGRPGCDRVNIGLPSLDAGTYRHLTRRRRRSPRRWPGSTRRWPTASRRSRSTSCCCAASTTTRRRSLELTRRLPVEVRFIEYMPIGPAKTPGGTSWPPARCSRRLREHGAVGGGRAALPGQRACPARFPRARRAGPSGLHHAGQRPLLQRVQPAAPDRRRAAAAVPAVAARRSTSSRRYGPALDAAALRGAAASGAHAREARGAWRTRRHDFGRAMSQIGG